MTAVQVHRQLTHTGCIMRLQDRMGLLDSTSAAPSASPLAPASASPSASSHESSAGASSSPGLPWWAQEMGMTEEEYWSGLQEAGPTQADLTGNRLQPVQITQASAMTPVALSGIKDSTVSQSETLVHPASSGALLLAEVQVYHNQQYSNLTSSASRCHSCIASCAVHPQTFCWHDTRQMHCMTGCATCSAVRSFSTATQCLFLCRRI